MKTILTKTVATAILIIFSALVYAEEKKDIKTEWVLAASVFTVEGMEQNPVLEEASKLIPQLILEECRAYSHRLITPHEQAQQALYKLRTEQNALYAERSKHILERDKIIFSAKEASATVVNKRIVDQNKKIAETEKKITESLAKSEKMTTLPFSFTAARLPLSLWKSDVSALYKKNSAQTNPFIEGINGVITGTITRRGTFISATAVLNVYPEGVEQAKITEVGNMSDAAIIAKNIAKQLLPLIIHDTPAILRIKITPPEAVQEAVLHLNGIQYRLEDTISVPPGSYALYITADGFESAQIRSEFESAKEYTVTAALKPTVLQEVVISAAETAGSFFLQGIPQGDAPATVAISEENILGEFLTQTGQSTFFQFTLPDNRKSTVATLSANLIPNTKDIAAGIENSRKSMYTAYGALLLSLPFSYLSYGAYVNAHNSWAKGFGSESERDYWQATSNITMGISIGCGVLLAVQLGRYLFMADKVIPKQVKIDGIKINY